MDKDLLTMLTLILGVISGIALVLLGILIPTDTDTIMYTLVTVGTAIIAGMFGISAIDARKKNILINNKGE